MTEAEVDATWRIEEAQPIGGRFDSPPLAASISSAEAEKTEALKQSILELIEIHRAAFLSAANSAAARGRPKADC